MLRHAWTQRASHLALQPQRGCNPPTLSCPKPQPVQTLRTLLTNTLIVPQDTDGETVFTDNDGLAARLAHELKAELVVLMTDVDGVFTGPPTNPDSKKIDVWCPEIHEEMIRLGEKSAHGRGGMGSKIKAAWCAFSRHQLLPLQLLSRCIRLRLSLV